MTIKRTLAISGMAFAILAAVSMPTRADDMRGERHDGGMRGGEGHDGRVRVERHDGEIRDREWHGEAWHGPRGPWHADFRHFDRHDDRLWRRGGWRQSWHDGRFGWWWVTGGGWFYYPQPVYPYPAPYNYVPLQTVVVQPPAPEPLAPQPQQYWYYCDSARGYYPYVASCPSGWRAVPATPPSAPSTTPPASPGR